MSKNVVIIGMAGILLLCAAALFYPDYDSPRVVKFLILTQVMLALSIGIFILGRRLDLDGRDSRLFIGLIILAVLTRAVMFWGAGDKFYQSDDIYRYVWDAKVNAAGINPYLHAPPDPALAPLRDTLIYSRINHPWLPTIYPPVAQNIFLASHRLFGDSTIGFKAVGVLCELLTILALLVWLRAGNIPRANILLWLFSPLILVEFHMVTHLDIFGIPFLVAAMISMDRRRPVLVGILLALATLVKFYGFFLAPFIFQYFGQRDRWLFAGSFAGAIVASYLPYVFGSEGNFLGSLFDYLEGWQYNASVFFILKKMMPEIIARYAVGALFITWMTFLWFSRSNVYQKLFGALAGFLILTTTFFPWYAVWIMPFVIRNLNPAFIYLSGAVLLSYHVHIGYYRDGISSPMPWLSTSVYTIFFGLLVWDLLRRRRKSQIYA